MKTKRKRGKVQRILELKLMLSKEVLFLGSWHHSYEEKY